MASWDCSSIENAFANAAVDPTQWVSALDTVSKVTESAGALLLPITGDLIRDIPYTHGLGGSVETYFRDGWHLRDERYRGMDQMVSRGVVDDLDIYNVDQIRRHRYYQEFLAPHNLRWFAGVKVASESDLWCLSIQRTIRQAPFTDDEKEKLAQLSRSLSSSAALARTLCSTLAQGALEAFEISRIAALLINGRGEAFKANLSAEVLLKGDVEIVKRRLVTKDRRTNNELERALRNLLERPFSAGLSTMICLPRKGRQPLLAHPVRLSGLAANVLADCQAIIILIDPEKRCRPPEAALRAAFQLTAAEARLACRMASGEKLETAAEELCISPDTGRNQLKSIFSKTGVHRQAELVATAAALLRP